VVDHKRRQILVVDDNRDLAKGMSIFLESEGFDVETVHDGREALRALRARRPDLVLLDIGLPGMDGFQVAQEMRRDPELKEVKIVAMSGYDEEMFPEPANRESFDQILLKPVDLNVISRLLARVL
jgi:CheY-like chemotaxis protein